MNAEATMNTTHTIDELDAIAHASRLAPSLERQRERRTREDQARRQTVELFQELHGRGRPCAKLAQELGVAPRTLADWRRRHKMLLSSSWRGRPVKESSWPLRHAVLDVLDHTGPRLGLPSLRALCPDLPRRELIELQADYRRHYRDTHRLSQERLTWSDPGRVWAVDHSDAPRPIDGIYPAILSVRDLSSGYQLAWLPVPDMEASSTALVLATLFAEHGPPLVLKSDNGSAFRSELVQNLLADHGLVWLPSPVRTPRYNGSCEAGIGSMKVRTLFLAAQESRVGTWSCDDLETARCQANALVRPDGHLGPAPDDLWSERSPITQLERIAFQAAVLHHRDILERQHAPLETTTTSTIARSLHRQAVRRALVELSLLSITRRSITLPLRLLKMAKIR
jgi:transposase InsO family protein